jgi:hypothetical protein
LASLAPLWGGVIDKQLHPKNQNEHESKFRLIEERLSLSNIKNRTLPALKLFKSSVLQQRSVFFCLTNRIIIRYDSNLPEEGIAFFPGLISRGF